MPQHEAVVAHVWVSRFAHGSIELPKQPTSTLSPQSHRLMFGDLGLIHAAMVWYRISAPSTAFSNDDARSVRRVDYSTCKCQSGRDLVFVFRSHLVAGGLMFAPSHGLGMGEVVSLANVSLRHSDLTFA